MCRVKMHDDHEQFARLVQRWERPIRRLCTRMTGDPGRGEDLKQETFLRLFERRKEYQPTGRFSTYLWRIALNLCYDELRRQERRRQFVRADPGRETEDGPVDCACEAPGPDARTVEQEEGELVRQALLKLPELYRTVIVLRHYENLKLAKIAEILEIPAGTVNSRMAEALTRLSRILGPRLRPEQQARAAALQSSRPAPNPSPDNPGNPNPPPGLLSRERYVL